MSENIVSKTDIDYYSAIIDGSRIAQLIVDNDLDDKKLCTSDDDAEINTKRYRSIILPVIKEYKEKYRQLTPNKLLTKILKDYAEKRGLLDNFDCQGFHFAGHEIKSYTWAVITKKDANIKNLKFSLYPQLYITINQYEIRFGFSYGDQVDSDIFVNKIRINSNIIDKMIQITNENPEIEFYQNIEELSKLSSENKVSPINFSTISKNWNRSSILVSVYPIPDLPQDIIGKIESVFNSLLEFFLEISGTQIGSTDVIEPNPIPTHTQRKKQVILYGPPGTGKTYGSVIRAHEIIYGYHDPTITFNLLQEKLKRQKSSDINYYQLSWIDAIVLAFKEIGKPKVKVDEIKNSEIIKLISKYKKSQRISITICYILQKESKLDSETVNLKNKSGREFFDKDTESNWYLTDKGLEYQQALVDDLTSFPETSSSQFNFIAFHQSFAYEDFIEGIRPNVTESDEATIYYEIKDGIFKEICKKAALDPNNNYVLIIDEINRGNISKIFGELITLLEENKRAGETEALTVKLPYSGEEFSVPNNVYIIGTMNSTDKSIALVDIALRRRFHFERLNVEYDIIKNQDGKTFLQELNGIICAIKNPDYEIGHYYLMNIPETDDNNEELKKVFSSRILPLLEEYFFNDWEALATILGRDSINISKKKKLVWDEDSGKFEEDSGGTDQIFGLSLKDVTTVFESTMKKLGISHKVKEISQ